GRRAIGGLSKVSGALEQNRRVRAEVRQVPQVRFGPSPNPGLRENNRIPSTSHHSLRSGFKLVHSATIPPPAPWSLRLRRVCHRDAATLPATTAQRRCRLYSTLANGLRLCNLHCCMRPIRDTPRPRCRRNSLV